MTQFVWVTGEHGQVAVRVDDIVRIDAVPVAQPVTSDHQVVTVIVLATGHRVETSDKASIIVERINNPPSSWAAMSRP